MRYYKNENEIQARYIAYILAIEEAGLTHDYVLAVSSTKQFSRIIEDYCTEENINSEYTFEQKKKENLKIKYAYVDFLLSRHIHNKTFGANQNTNYTMQEQLEYCIRGAIHYIRLTLINGYNEDIHDKFKAMIGGIFKQLNNIRDYNYKQIEIRKKAKYTKV